MPEARTVREALQRLADQLAAGGLPQPRREALRLIEAMTGQGPASIFSRGEEGVDPALEAALSHAAARRVAGEPHAYVTGSVGFRYLEITCDARALIPRPETEGLVELVLAECGHGTVCDVGTGTGCIAASLATEGSYHTIVATEISRPTLALARENLALAAAADVHLVLGDLTQPLAELRLDALVANPPYLTSGEYAELDSAVREWEPKDALVSGSDGLAATRSILVEGRRLVRPGGLVALEIDCHRAERTAMLAGAAGWQRVEIRRDLFGRERFLLARRSDRD